MKTLILLIFIATLSYSQGGINTTIRNVTDTVNVGDSLKINFTYTVGFSGTQVQIVLITDTYSQDCINQNYNTLYSANPKCYYDIDGTTYMKVLITPSIGTGNLKVFSNMGYKMSYIRSSVGIKEYSKNNIVDVKYYDIYGKEKPSIEGLTIRVTTYSNGYQNKEKVIIQPL